MKFISYLTYWLSYFADIVYLCPGRKFTKIIVDGYIYRKQKMLHNKTSWRCIDQHKTKCGGSLRSYDKIIELATGHNHDRPVWNPKIAFIPQKVVLKRIESIF